MGTADHFDRHILLSAKLAACQPTGQCPRAGEVELGGNYVHIAATAHRQNCEDWRVKRILEDVCERIQALTPAL